MYKSDTLQVGPASAGDLKTMRTLAESLIIPVRQEGDLLIIGPMSAGDRTAISNKALALGLGLGCADYEAPEEKPEEPPAVDLTEVLAALARIEATQAQQGRQLAAVDAKAQHVVDKLARAGSALAK